MSGLYQNARIEEKLDQLLAGGGTSSAASALPPGYLAPFFAEAIPAGWLALDGQAIAIADNPALYALFADRYSSVLDVPSMRAAAAQQYPNMTANQQSGWVASSDSNNTTAYRAFDGVLPSGSTTNCWNAADKSGHYLELVAPQPQYLASYHIYARGQATGDVMGNFPPSQFTIEGLVGGQWIVLDSRTGISWSQGANQSFDVADDMLRHASTAYRLVIPAGEDEVIGELQLRSVTDSSPYAIIAPAGSFGLPNLSSSPADLPGSVWCVKAG